VTSKLQATELKMWNLGFLTTELLETTLSGIDVFFVSPKYYDCLG